jgi:Protein of unknown function (DUF2442)
MDPHVKSVRALDDYELEASFENGECRRFDVKPFPVAWGFRAAARPLAVSSGAGGRGFRRVAGWPRSEL